MFFAKKTPKVTAYLFSLTGCIGVFSYSPFDYWGLAYLSAFGLIWAVTYQNRKIALWATFFWSIGYFCSGVNWVSISMMQFGGVPIVISYLAVVLLAIYLALYNLLFCWISQYFRFNNPFVLASIFTFTEYLRGVIFTGFPWLQFGYTHIDSPFYGLAPIFGVEGLTFFVIVISGYLVQLFCKFAKSSDHLTASFYHIILPLCSMLIVGFGSQYLHWVTVDNNKTTKISLVQPNIEQKIKWNPYYFNQHIQTYQRLITPLLDKTDIIILPESAFPAMETQIKPLLQQLQQTTTQRNNTFIIGTLNNTDTNLYNSAIVLNAQQPYSHSKIERYNKHHLVPFGEYVPFGNLLNWLRDIFILPINLSQGDFIQKPLKTKNTTFNMAICYEVIFGHQIQQNQRIHNADYLLTISNDAWFGNSIGPWQHLQIARMRALELGKPLARATNTGITVFVDHLGNIIKQVPQFEEATLSTSLHSTKGTTPFTSWGYWLIYGLSLLCFSIAIIRHKRQNR
ncbi:apolipoprotein N-acyltransferase [Pasteurella skyensis]|uniref:Apolipoprotein N-acyltransferase n=1 Tax=Phocoenobacter skyensis TaxID=97481 RepID=A0AAJ6N898_9PAST|nr:apolipoprotein N-acyltransferase [Pasteurella skyensis]MDP8161884.1 apolipoprotein N-acyltransferase [Pasteurella skyensis]MDP8172040.1 apolipoprotein N-acyltransferase [Pasteurella skyensis]MDP8176275.1 apolipoprotein N-acyltransferase [Pasteurella skyensis]MDP8178295.1 apolipoprotein N-acyltransferase [Pasteurella skyensis]MDP8182097.1 apolipoprotein N-acyltransferase [Pasteurella skyensis]